MSETILQFGAGNFLRAFVDSFVAQANHEGQNVGSIVVVQSTGRERADALNAAGGAYHVATQGYENGQVVDRIERVDSISRALIAGTEWPKVFALAASPDLQWIVSNTTEAGFALDALDTQQGRGVPFSFPAKLLDVLLARHRAGLPGLSVVPCELIEHNADRLRALVLEQAQCWHVDEQTQRWLSEECHWLNNLVDRIVPGKPAQYPLAASDPLLLSAEPFAFWAVQTQRPFLCQHPAVVLADDISPYYLRKVRLLNGAHTALVAHAMPLGFTTVRECVENAEVLAWLEALLFEEIVPVLEGRVDDASGFACATLDRFRNPFLDHKLSAIALHHETKLQVRLAPSLVEYRALMGKDAPRLSALLK